MKQNGTVCMLFTKANAKGHHAVAARSDQAGRDIHEGHGQTREEAIAKALHCNRIFYANPDVERDILVAEAREDTTQWRLRDHMLIPLELAA